MASKRPPGAPAPRRVLVTIVGAGPAGLGMARVLRDLAIPCLVLERDRIGASFRRWPAGMRFISPSFPGNAFGLTDLNAISYDSSPAYTLGREHPSGADYARYLRGASEAFGIGVTTGVDVTALAPDDGAILLHTTQGPIRSRFVIWAAGQFQYPDLTPFPGAELGIHTSRVPAWTQYPGQEEALAIGLAQAGRKVTVLSRSSPWAEEGAADPSVALSPYTQQRLRTAVRKLPIKLIGGVDVLGLARDDNAIRVLAADGRSWRTETKPLLATGFTGSTGLIADWFDWDGSHPVLTAQDESSVLPGLFLVGPEVRHGAHLFCFIYKFRQRFAVVARAIAGRLGIDTDPLEPYRSNNMFLDDLSCCDQGNCVC